MKQPPLNYLFLSGVLTCLVALAGCSESEPESQFEAESKAVAEITAPSKNVLMDAPMNAPVEAVEAYRGDVISDDGLPLDVLAEGIIGNEKEFADQDEDGDRRDVLASVHARLGLKQDARLKAVPERVQAFKQTAEGKSGKRKKRLRQRRQPGASARITEVLSAGGLFEALAPVQAVSTQAAAGYWENTYVPGDPLFRQLHFQAKTRTATQAVHRVWQPFDPPEGAAMSVYLSANKSAIPHKTRLLLQVGLKGSAHHRGHRPAMTVGIVLDMTQAISPATAANMQALLSALVKAKQIGDQFSLTLAGQPGGTLIPPQQFQYGGIKLAQDYLFSGGVQPNTSTQNLSLVEAMQTATQQVTQNDNPSAPLGASLVILVTPNLLQRQVAALVRIAHRSALQGIPQSVIGVGQQAHHAAIDRIILAGQGHRRFMTEPSTAKAVVQRELNAISQVVARAIRVNIRLGPQVQLVQVLGAKRLDQARTQAAKAIEKSIDLRLAKNLGIRADRGQDDAGIQILIPAYYANDDHVILLDVIAQAAGTLADVEIRYKDLAYAKNSVLQVRLSLGSHAKPVGPLQKNVYKNYLALRFSSLLSTTATHLQRGQSAQAIAQLADFQQQLMRLPVWMDAANDVDIQRDSQLLLHYQQWIRSEPQAMSVANALRYASFAKRLTTPSAHE